MNRYWIKRCLWERQWVISIDKKEKKNRMITIQYLLVTLVRPKNGAYLKNNRSRLKKSKYTMNRSKLLSFLIDYLKCHLRPGSYQSLCSKLRKRLKGFNLSKIFNCWYIKHSEVTITTKIEVTLKSCFKLSAAVLFTLSL